MNTIAPYGVGLVDLVASGAERGELLSRICELPSLQLAARAVYDLGCWGRGRPLPEWFTPPGIAQVVPEAQPPLHGRGSCVWFTGLSGAGKSATAEALTALLLERRRPVTIPTNRPRRPSWC